jgi:hypothetical protein
MDGLEENFTRPRQVRYQAALRPDVCWLPHFKTLLDSPLTQREVKLVQIGLTVAKPDMR